METEELVRFAEGACRVVVNSIHGVEPKDEAQSMRPGILISGVAADAPGATWQSVLVTDPELSPPAGRKKPSALA